MYLKIRLWLCKRLGWHAPGSFWIPRDEEHLGLNTHAKCKWCGFEGLIDSQGNLF